MGDTERGQPTGGTAFLLTCMRGAAIGCVAAVVQVLVSQIVGLATGHRERTDVAPRLVQRSAERLGTSPSRPLRWFLATVFHFGYGIGWGVLYTLACGSPRLRRTPPWLSGGLLGGVVYTLAFSRIGGGTLVGSERHPDRRGWYELVIHWASALSFAQVVAYTERWSRDGLGQAEDGEAHG